MILPGKHLREDRALISIGGEILSILGGPRKVSDVWEEVRALRAAKTGSSQLPFDWFVLAMSLLFALKAIDFVDGSLVPRRVL